MKTVDGVPQFEDSEGIAIGNLRSALYGDANQRLREHFANRKCVNCFWFTEHKERARWNLCDKIVFTFSDAGISPETFSCAAFEVNK